MAPGVAERLVALHETGHTRILFNTGRSCENLISVAALPFPIEIWGCHGRTHRDLDGRTTVHGLNGTNTRGLEIGHDRIRERLTTGSFVLRDGCLTVFYEEATPEERIRIASLAREVWEDLLSAHHLHIDEFFAGIELSALGRDKGDAMEAILSSVDPDRVPVAFLGDAPTDEDGFRAMKGRGLAVLVDQGQVSKTAADVILQPFDGVLEFLDRWLLAVQPPSIKHSQR